MFFCLNCFLTYTFTSLQDENIQKNRSRHLGKTLNVIFLFSKNKGFAEGCVFSVFC